MGAVRYTEKHGLGDTVFEDALAEVLAAIAADLDRLDDRASPDTLVAMGGAVTNLAAVKHGLAEYDSDIVQVTVLDRTEIDRQIELYRTRTPHERLAVIGLQPQRADLILAGACIVRTVLDKIGKESLAVSDRGLRHGLLVERSARGSLFTPSGGWPPSGRGPCLQRGGRNGERPADDPDGLMRPGTSMRSGRAGVSYVLGVDVDA